MSRRVRKSSACVTLVLIGAAALAGCSDQNPANRRASYASKSECLADWGDDKECEQQETRSTSGVHSGYYWGPSYRSPSRAGSGSSRSSASSGGHSVSRGGFGSHGSSAS